MTATLDRSTSVSTQFWVNPTLVSKLVVLQPRRSSVSWERPAVRTNFTLRFGNWVALYGRLFLLNYLADQELRVTIQAATNKSESFNNFVQWLLFGGYGIIAENDRDEQKKIIKYNHLVANCLIFHNVYSLTHGLSQFALKGHSFSDEAIARLSPYLTEHVNRFGAYTLNFERNAPPPEYKLSFRLPGNAGRTENGV